MAERPFASVLIPTRNPGPSFQQVLDAIARQQVEFPFEIIIVDSESRPEDVALMRQHPGVVFHQIARASFGHGRTRNLLGGLARGEVLLFLSQDAEPASPHWMRTLIEPLNDVRVAGAYARQLPRSGADPLIRFFLAATYGPQPARRVLRSCDGARRLSINDIFFSNVSSAIRRDVWQQHPFREDVVMSEDQYWAYDVLCAGYEVVYHPAAQVYHSHNYSLRTLFSRNRASGASLRGLIADSPTAIASRGLMYIAGQARYLIRNGRAHWLPYMLVYEATKAAGFSFGLRFGV